MFEFITDTKEITKRIENMIATAEKFYMAVAWAEMNCPLSQALRVRVERKKETKIVVGVSFYETDPEFLRQMTSCVRIATENNGHGLFHPKVYVGHNANKLDIIVGSHNFTRAAFTQNGCNQEASGLVPVPVNSQAANDILAWLNRGFHNGISVRDFDLDGYQAKYDEARQKKKTQGASTSSESNLWAGGASNIVPQKYSWESSFSSYVEKLKSYKSFEPRLKVLEEMRKIRHKAFADMSAEERALAAGILTVS